MSDINDKYYENKLKLIVRRPQSGKTFICIKDIENNQRDLHIILTMEVLLTRLCKSVQILKLMVEQLG